MRLASALAFHYFLSTALLGRRAALRLGGGAARRSLVGDLELSHLGLSGGMCVVPVVVHAPRIEVARRATIEAKGETWEVVEPEVVDWEVARPLLPRVARLVLYELGGIKRYLTVRKISEAPSAMVGDGGTQTTVETPARTSTKHSSD